MLTTSIANHSLNTVNKSKNKSKNKPKNNYNYNYNDNDNDNDNDEDTLTQSQKILIVIIFLVIIYLIVFAWYRAYICSSSTPDSRAIHFLFATADPLLYIIFSYAVPGMCGNK